MNERILITGVTGFVGSHLADFIIEKFPEKEIYATRRYHLSRMDNVYHMMDKLNWVDCDITGLLLAKRLSGSCPTGFFIARQKACQPIMGSPQ